MQTDASSGHGRKLAVTDRSVENGPCSPSRLCSFLLFLCSFLPLPLQVWSDCLRRAPRGWRVSVIRSFQDLRNIIHVSSGHPGASCTSCITWSSQGMGDTGSTSRPEMTRGHRKYLMPWDDQGTQEVPHALRWPGDTGSTSRPEMTRGHRKYLMPWDDQGTQEVPHALRWPGDTGSTSRPEMTKVLPVSPGHLRAWGTSCVPWSSQGVRYFLCPLVASALEVFNTLMCHLVSSGNHETLLIYCIRQKEAWFNQPNLNLHRKKARVFFYSNLPLSNLPNVVCGKKKNIHLIMSEWMLIESRPKSAQLCWFFPLIL